MNGNGSMPGDTYREREARFAGERDRHTRRSRVLSNGRVVAFAAVIALGLLLERRPSSLLLPATIVAAVTFVVLIVLHRRSRSRERWFDALTVLNAEGLDRLARRWERLPVRTPTRSLEGHAYAADLDLYGRASIAQILGPAATPFGCAALDGWLLSRSEPESVRARQDAVREMAPLHDLREALALHGRAARTIQLRHIERFLSWAESPPRTRHIRLRILAWALPAATWLLIGAQALGMVESARWLIPVAASFIVYGTIGARARRTFDDAFGREPLFTYYPDMIRALAGRTFRSPLLASLAQRLVRDGMPADRQLGALRRLMHLADFRLSSMHVPLFLVTLWDLHVLIALERWQAAWGAAVRDWLEALGEAEALSALATLAHDHPSWVFPELVPMAEALVEAEALGHPLIPDAVRVHNDVVVGPPGTFLLVTGSNMSGKSTLLRALGTNAVLAQAGAPVCAARLRLPPLEVYTSIRVQDSLARGVSYFMAELERLKQIVDAAQRARAGGSATLLFLLDEILHGTNTAERRIAATRVIRHLVDSGAIGAATTHDLALAEVPALTAAARLVHFTEDVVEVDGASTLRFDYRLREGLATSTNALALMRIVGLPDA
ncbi:MAG TPA: MutS family DNA mismatch repair protein [Longimicrobiales bacterium]